MADFNISIEAVLKAEGGYQNSSSDKGNYNSLGENIGTNYGISAPTLENWLRKVPSKNDMINLSRSTAISIYKKMYWTPYNFDKLNDQFIANHIFDMFVNSSPRAAATIVQKAVNALSINITAIDGIWGAGTLGAVNKLCSQGLAVKLNDELIKFRSEYYKSLNNVSFIDGWLNRANKFAEYIKYSKATTAITPLIAISFFF